MANIGDLLSEGMKIKSRMDADKARLAEINRELEALAVFPDGKSTAHVAANGFRATIQRKTTVKWDQKKLAKALDAMGKETFSKVFTYEFKPLGKKQLDAFLEFGLPGEVACIQEAMTVAEGAPQVKYEYVAEAGDGAD